MNITDKNISSYKMMTEINAKKVLNFIEEIGKLKTLPRSGWRFHGIVGNTESISDHCYRVSLIAMLLGDILVEYGLDLDMDKVMRISLLHEIAEARIGDIPFPAFKYIDEEYKSKAEDRAVREMLDNLGEIGKRYYELWTEFEKCSSLEGKVVKASDKLELMIQVYQYEKVGYRCLDRFWTNPWNMQQFDLHEFIEEIMKVLVEKRTELFAERNEK